MSIVTCVWQGRCGNIFYQTAMAYAYALEYDLEFRIPTIAYSCNNEIYFYDLPFPKLPQGATGILYDEPNPPAYHNIPYVPSITFRGYWQSFKYFDKYRDQVVKAFNIPYTKTEEVSIHVRRGDYLVFSDAFPPLGMEYYKNAIKYFNDLGHTSFMVFSDDIPWCRIFFTPENFPGCSFKFSEGNNEMRDLSLMSSCAHNIIANSSFSFVASWLNQNPDKIVVSPKKENLFRGANADMIPDNYIQIPNA